LAQGGRTGVVAISFDGRSETALLKGLQRDPRSGQLVHVDFQAVSMDQEVTSVVPIRFVGESEAVTRLDGVMTHPRTELRVAARASDLPDIVEVDVSVLTELHAAIHVSDLLGSSTYQILEPAEEVLATVLPPKREVEELEAPEEAAAEAPETAEAAESTTEASAASESESEPA